MKFRILLALLAFNVAPNVQGATADSGTQASTATMDQPVTDVMAAPSPAKATPILRVTLLTDHGLTTTPEIGCSDAEDLAFYWDRPVSKVDSALMENPEAFQQWYSANCSVNSVALAGEMAH